MVPEINSENSLYHIHKGFYDWSILSKNKRGKTIVMNRGTPCMSIEHNKQLFLQKPTFFWKKEQNLYFKELKEHFWR